ncbi:MAG: betaine-aldehyde dehydrogenase [Acidimicrobiia bacterium]|nr:betaine-aldehyde dehydrogenase [Acidimicrobiia bacterium]
MTTAAVQRPFINGDFVDLAPVATFPTHNPATGEVLADVQYCDEAVVDRAVAAAAQAQPTWAQLSGTERARRLRRVADELFARNDELARVESLDTGRPIAETRLVDVASGAECFEYFASVAATLVGEAVPLPGMLAYTERRPLGVCAGIGAWNYPLQIACWKAAPALACGNTVVFKPAELTPLTASVLAEIIIDAGLPPGVFNVVHGDAECGQALVAHPDVAKVSLTGEVGTGRAVMAAAAPTLKHVTLELGGKSPLVVFDDAALDDAVTGAMLGNFYSQGEICSNGTRVFVHRSVHDRFVEQLVARTAKLRLGDPLDPATHVGPLISTAHAAGVRAAIDAAVAEGATPAAGGAAVPAVAPPLQAEAYVQPTVFVDCVDHSRLVREEIFGPVMAVLAFDDEDEVVARANATPYGLAAGVFTRDVSRAHRVAGRLDAGVCWINTYNVTPIEVPFGGVKQSGIGRENGPAAIEHYTERKTVLADLGSLEDPWADD